MMFSGGPQHIFQTVAHDLFITTRQMNDRAAPLNGLFNRSAITQIAGNKLKGKASYSRGGGCGVDKRAGLETT